MLNLRIANRTLLSSNLSLTEGQVQARMTADKAAASGAITVDNISGFSVGKYILLGNFGEPTAEIIRIHAATAPTGTTITLASNTVFDHFSDTPVTLINYNQVEFSRATTLTGSKSVLATQAIEADRLESGYVDLTNSTGFAFVRFKNSSDSVYSSYSTGVSYSGLSYLSVSEIVKNACDNCGLNIGDAYASESQLLNDANRCQDEITKLDWVQEIVKDSSSLAATENEDTYALSSLTNTIKYTGTAQAIKSVLFGSDILKQIDPDDMDEIKSGTTKSYLNGAVSQYATSIVLDDSSEFADSGYVTVGSLTFAYTTNTVSTNTLSGISASAITSALSDNASVWQGSTNGYPTKYCVLDGNIILDAPVDTEYVGYKIKITYLKEMSQFTEFADTVEFPFINAFENYIGSRIERRKKNYEESARLYNLFIADIKDQHEKFKLPTLDTYTYYNFFDL